MAAYYNEIDLYVAEWLQNLMDGGHIAAGEIDTRSIEDVRPGDLKGFTQCHFFAGIGVWPFALRNAGWPDDRPVWTGSCPCQPFSAAGKGRGFADERHLWPHFYWLISQCRPVAIFGEQVASKDGRAWISTVQADLERVDYRLGVVDTCAAGFGAPNIRQRLYWVADSCNAGLQGAVGIGQAGTQEQSGGHSTECGNPYGLADSIGSGQQRTCRGSQTQEQRIAKCGLFSSVADADGEQYDRRECISETRGCQSANACSTSRLADSIRSGAIRSDSEEGGRIRLDSQERCICGQERNEKEQFNISRRTHPLPYPVNGFWRGADWLGCRDNKFRPVEPGTFPLVDESSRPVGRGSSCIKAISALPKKEQGHRAGRLKGYGNALNAEQAKFFVEAYLELELDQLQEEF